MLNLNMYIACYAQRFGPRGIGHAGGTFLGLMCDALDLEWQRYLWCTSILVFLIVSLSKNCSVSLRLFCMKIIIRLLASATRDLIEINS